MNVGDGWKAALWFDNWSHLGSLINHITYRDLYVARLSTYMRIAEILVNGIWSWPDEWYTEFPMIT